MRSLRNQLLLYQRRCERMRLATNSVLSGGILLVATLISATLAFVLSQPAFLKYLTVTLSVSGMVLVIAGAVLVLADSTSTQRVIEEEVADIPDLAPHSPERVR